MKMRDLYHRQLISLSRVGRSARSQRAYGAGAAAIAGSTGLPVEDIKAMIEDAAKTAIGQAYSGSVDALILGGGTAQ
jgi:hypothetical protein